MDKQIVKSESQAYGYNYASLADIVNQGFKLPVMETRNIEGETFMGWLDEKNEWHQGAPLIVPEMKGMNAAQAMGSALTYARRYTAQMALGLACDDDSKLEKTKGAPEATGRVYGKKVDFRQIREELQTISDTTLSEKQARVGQILEELRMTRLKYLKDKRLLDASKCFQGEIWEGFKYE